MDGNARVTHNKSSTLIKFSAFSVLGPRVNKTSLHIDTFSIIFQRISLTIIIFSAELNSSVDNTKIKKIWTFLKEAKRLRCLRP